MKKQTSSYHYGHLGEELLTVALAQGRLRGPTGLSLRALARQVGVSPTATYRHYKNQADLLAAVKRAIAEQLAAFMTRQVAALPVVASEQERATMQLQALCEAYVLFALEEPGLFRTANSQAAGQATSLDDLVHNAPFVLFKEAFAELVRTGYLSAANRPAAEITLWSTTHGLATLLLDSPLQHLEASQKQPLIGQTISSALKGVKD